MKQHPIIYLACLFALLGTSCKKKEESKGKVTFTVWQYAPSFERKAMSVEVIIFSNGNRIEAAMTDSNGMVSFMLTPGMYTAVAETGDATSDKAKTFDPANSDANGPHEFRIKTDEEQNIEVVMDDKTAAGSGGWANISVRKFSETGPPCDSADITVFLTMGDALNGSPYIVKQTASNQGITALLWDTGFYYIVATWQDVAGVKYTSDTTKVKNYTAGPPPNSKANGPQKIKIERKRIGEYTAVVDLRE